MLSSFTVNYRIVALLIFPQHQKQNTKSKSAMPHTPDAWLQARTQNDVVYGIGKKDIPVKRLYRDFEIFKESYGCRGCVLEGKDKYSLYRHRKNERELRQLHETP
jgi:hypothetical protein